jgi:hypothetical protein
MKQANPDELVAVPDVGAYPETAAAPVVVVAAEADLPRSEPAPLDRILGYAAPSEFVGQCEYPAVLTFLARVVLQDHRECLDGHRCPARRAAYAVLKQTGAMVADHSRGQEWTL